MKMKHIYILLLATLQLSAYSQNATLTAEQILDSSIAFCGGEKAIANLKNCQLTYILIQPDSSVGVIDEKRIEGQKYVQCILSKENIPQTTFFDGKEVFDSAPASSLSYIFSRSRFPCNLARTAS